jgi:lysophospholipase L1-like esterase
MPMLELKEVDCNIPTEEARTVTFPIRNALTTAALTVIVLTWASCPARAGIVFFDSFENRPAATGVHGTLPEIGNAPYALQGAGMARTVANGGETALDIAPGSASGLMLFGPAMGAERWIRLDFASQGSANVVITPQVQTGLETAATGLPGIWPAVSADWGLINTYFAGSSGGTASPLQINLATAYPACDRDKPFRAEIHWTVRSPTKAVMEIRIWNGGPPPAWSPSARTEYTLTTGAWSDHARAALWTVGGVASVCAIAEYDAAPEATIVTADDPGISYSGRWEAVNSGEMHAAGAGQRFRFLASGPSCALMVRGVGEDGNIPPISVRVDGAGWERLSPTGGTEVVIPLYEGKSWGPHVVEVLTSAMDGQFWATESRRLILLGVRLEPGGSSASMPWPQRPVLALGDSVTCGYFVYSGNMQAAGNPQSDARWAAVQLVSDWLGRDVINASIQGVGYCRPSYGVTSQTFFEQPLQGIDWQPERVPEDIIVQLGGNDAALKDGFSFVYPDQELRAAVSTYLTTLRTWFPHARIYLLTPFNGTRAYVLRAGFDDVNDANSLWVDTRDSAPSGPWIDRSAKDGVGLVDTTDGTHPNIQGNIKIAHRLVTMLGADASVKVRLDWPSSGATVTGRVVVRGSARGDDTFSGATLEFGAGNAPSTWTPIHSTTTPMSESLLGVWDTRGLAPGRYTLRLRAAANGRTSTSTVTVTVGLSGDVDGDGAVTAADAAAALRAAAGLTAMTESAMNLADVSPALGAGGRYVGDGRVNMDDALALLRTVAAPMDNPAPARLH